MGIDWVYILTNFIIKYLINDNMNHNEIELLSFILASKRRMKILKLLNEIFQTPTLIAKKTKITTYEISKLLAEMKTKKIVYCLNPNKRKGKFYGLTDIGKRILKLIKQIEHSGL